MTLLKRVDLRRPRLLWKTRVLRFRLRHEEQVDRGDSKSKGDARIGEMTLSTA